jgi:hypothetical protein
MLVEAPGAGNVVVLVRWSREGGKGTLTPFHADGIS